ncbi:MAG: helix-turn-helix transcriptional regulator, partial [Arenibacter algicola]|nr:helix-turn-helix transcriptional regulator [Arenibacter algicola]
LSVLKLAGLVFQRKEGRWVYYRLADKAVNPYALGVLAMLRDSLDDDVQVSSDRARLEEVGKVALDVLCTKGVDLTAVCEGAEPETVG